MNGEIGDSYTIEPPITQAEEDDFKSVAARLNEDLGVAATKLADSVQGFTSLIQTFVSAGEALERSIAIHRELGAASQRAVEDAREAARSALASAGESQSARDASKAVLDLTTEQYGTVSELVENLRQRIAALSVLAAPMPRVRAKETTPEKVAEAPVEGGEPTDAVTVRPEEGSWPAEPVSRYWEEQTGATEAVTETQDFQSPDGASSAERPPDDGPSDEEWKRRLAAEVDDLSARDL
jgi:hypothetical protein